jgi:hypothetical protein
LIAIQKIVSDQDIACPATLSDPAILCYSAILSNPATLSDPAILCNSAILSNLAMPNNPATFSNLSMLSNADDVMLMSPRKSKDVHVNNSTPTAFNPPEGTFPWDGESAQLKPQLINDLPNKEKITLNRPAISLPIAERAIKTLGVTNSVDFFKEICSIMPR